VVCTVIRGIHFVIHMSHQNHYIFNYTNYYNTYSFKTKRKNMDILNGHSYDVENTCFKIQNCNKHRQTFSVKLFWIQITYSELFKIQLSKHSSFAEWFIFYWMIKPETDYVSPNKCRDPAFSSRCCYDFIQN